MNIGRLGEETAAKLLQEKGYKILERNWGNKWGEVDVICRDGDVFVFVEVKAKVGHDFGSPEEMINPRKLRQVERMAQMYLASRPTSHKASFGARIDVVAVVFKHDLSVERASHYEAVY